MRKTRRQFVTDITKYAGLALLGRAFSASATPTGRVRREIRDIATNYPDDLQRLANGFATMAKSSFGGVTAWELNAQYHANRCGVTSGEIHRTLNFYPWHRGFLLATELNMQAATGDSSITLPYWHWPLGASGQFIPIPDPYFHGALDHPGRVKQLHATDADYSQMDKADVFKGEFVSSHNGPIATKLGFGGYSLQPVISSAIEGTPHNVVHNDTGGDMSDLKWSPRDPLFYGHHGSLDRLWEVWRANPARAATEPWDDPAFGNQTFSYYKYGSSTPRTFSISDLRDQTKLGYSYSDPVSSSVTFQKMTEDRAAQTFSSSDFDPPIASSRAVLRSTSSKRELMMLSNVPKRALLTLVGVAVPAGRGATAAIFISDEAVGPFKLDTSVFAGTFGAVAVHHASVVNFAIDITEAVTKLHPKGSIRVVLLPYKDSNFKQELSIKSFVISTD